MTPKQTNTLEVEIFKAIWKNNATIEVCYYTEPVEGESNSDRIQLIIKQEGGKQRGWLMNIQDATDIIYGLSKGISRAIEDNVPAYHNQVIKNLDLHE